MGTRGLGCFPGTHALASRSWGTRASKHTSPARAGEDRGPRWGGHPSAIQGQDHPGGDVPADGTQAVTPETRLLLLLPPCPRARSHRPAAVLGHRGLLALSLKPLEAATDPGAAGRLRGAELPGAQGPQQGRGEVPAGGGGPHPKARGWAGPVSPGVTRLKKGIGSVHMQMGTLWDRAGDSLSNTSQLPAQAGRTAVPSPDPSPLPPPGHRLGAEAVATSSSWMGSPSMSEGQERVWPPGSGQPGTEAGQPRRGQAQHARVGVSRVQRAFHCHSLL